MRDVTAYIALGANLGHPRAMFDAVVRGIDARPECQVIARSRWHVTTPVGRDNQPEFLNGAIAVRTVLTPVEIFTLLQDAEERAGRDRRAEDRWGPRVLDLDLLLYGDLTLETPDLTIPHPRMHERSFVLDPLAEIAPFVRHPVLRRTIRDLRDAAGSASSKPLTDAGLGRV